MAALPPGVDSARLWACSALSGKHAGRFARHSIHGRNTVSSPRSAPSPTPPASPSTGTRPGPAGGGTKTTILADRGLADTSLFGFLGELGFDYVIRLKANTQVSAAAGTTRLAAGRIGQGGRARKLRAARITAARCPVGAVVCVHAKGMKEA